MGTIKKELLIEEKAKRYDEALERAKEKHAMFKGMKQGDILEDVFPELKESEDERIRKEIIEAIKGQMVVLHPKECIAWLEKQGEQKPQGKSALEAAKEEKVDNQNCVKPADRVEPKFKVKYAGSEYNVFETKDIAGVTFYGIEDEPNHIDYVKADNCEIISGGYGIKENGSPYPTKPAVFSEHKPAWSEQDKNMLQSILDEYKSMPIEKRNWLKSLKDRVQPQNKYKESLATADLENSLCDIQDGFSDTSYEYRILGEAIEFIRCTKPKPQWKPSDEQMDVLLSEVTAWTKGCPKQIVLESLYQDLKKLREE